MEANTILSVQDLHISFDRQEVLRGLSFSVTKGDVLAIVGPNGAGKSVLFRALLGLIPHSGTIAWADHIKISYIPQRFTIDKEFPLTVQEFLEFKTKNHAKITETLYSVGITDKQLLSQRLGWLSGGQLQRILIAWAMLDNPDVLLFDEPTAGIDVEGEETIYNLIKKLHDKHHFTILIISHDLHIVYEYATNVLCINKDMVCYGIPEEVLDPSALKKLYGGQAKFYSHKHD